MKMTLILVGLLGLSLLVGCAIVPLEPFGVYGHRHGGYYGYDRGAGHGHHYDRGHYRGYHGEGPGYYR